MSPRTKLAALVRVLTNHTSCFGSCPHEPHSAPIKSFSDQAAANAVRGDTNHGGKVCYGKSAPVVTSTKESLLPSVCRVVILPIKLNCSPFFDAFTKVKDWFGARFSGILWTWANDKMVQATKTIVSNTLWFTIIWILWLMKIKTRFCGKQLCLCDCCFQ